MEQETDQLRQAMRTRPVIDQARGMLMALTPCTPATAWEVLVEVSQHTNTKLRDIAAELVATAYEKPLPRHIREALLEAMARHEDSQG
nr:ANTAR domain-containing protein [Streptomyces albus]